MIIPKTEIEIKPAGSGRKPQDRLVFVRQAVAIVQTCTGMLELSFLLEVLLTIRCINEVDKL